MNDNYSQRFQQLLLTSFILVMMTSGISAQLILEREFVGAVATMSTNTSNGNTGELQVDASFGESMIGYKEGDIVITVGFHQPGAPSTEGDFGHRFAGNETEYEAESIVVNAYPNPTVSRLTVDLGTFRDKFQELRLVDVFGRTVASRQVEDQSRVTISQLDDLPNANYFLQGLAKDGDLHQLTIIVLIKE
jgi:hypothetical protein